MDNRKLRILAIGRNAEIMTVMQRLLNAPDNWTGLAVTTNEAAIAAFSQEAFDIVLLCAGVSTEEEATLSAQFRQQAPDVIVKRHYGGGSGLLKNEIQYALEHR
jgi:PleD family two-component response regulator